MHEKNTIEHFKGAIIQDLQKTSLMEVMIYPPKVLTEGKSNFKDIGEYLKYTCESSQLPGYTFLSENRYISGLVTEMPITQTHEKLVLTFLCTNATIERQFFDKWFETIQSPLSYEMEYYDVYVAPQIDVMCFNECGDYIYKVRYHRCYPITIATQNLTWAETNAVRMTVDFAYEKYEKIPIDEQKETHKEEREKNRKNEK